MIEFEYDKTGVGMLMELFRSKAKSTREKVQRTMIYQRIPYKPTKDERVS